MERTLQTSARARAANPLRQYSPHDDSSELYPDDPAYRAVTDFQHDGPITVPASYPLDAAQGDLRRPGVHALFVTREEPGCSEARFIGLVTRHELQAGGAPQAEPSPAAGAAAQRRVAEVMTPVEALAVARYASLRGMTVQDVSEMFEETGLAHLLVVDGDGGDLGIARGLISRALLALRLRGSSPIR